MPKVTLPIVTVTFDGRSVVVDPRTLTIKERSTVKGELAKLAREHGIEPDDTDTLAVTVWAVLRRDEPDLTFDEFSEQFTFGDLLDVETDDEDPNHPEASGAGS